MDSRAEIQWKFKHSEDNGLVQTRACVPSGTKLELLRRVVLTASFFTHYSTHDRHGRHVTKKGGRELENVLVRVVGWGHRLLCSVMARLARLSARPVLLLWAWLYLYPFKLRLGYLLLNVGHGEVLHPYGCHSFRSPSFRGLKAGIISVRSKWADPSCRACFDQTLPLAWQICSRGSCVNAWASKQAHKTRCSKRNKRVRSNVNKQAQQQEMRGVWKGGLM